MSNPYKIIEPTCISFSGGRTSAFMLWKILEAHQMSLPDQAIVCFQNTGKEDEATLAFIHECETRWNVKIHWIEYRNNDQGYAVVDYESASRQGEPFEELIRKNNYLPSPVKRICTAQLKIRPQAKYMRDLRIFGDTGYSAIENMCWVGIRADEERRAAKIEDKSRIPLWSDNVTKEIVGKFWRESDFDLGLPNMNVSINLTVNFVSKGKLGEKIIAKATLDKQGMTIINTSCELRNHDGQLLSRGSCNLVNTNKDRAYSK